MNTYQLACGCWQPDTGDYAPGGVLVCLNHGRQVVIGFTSPLVLRGVTSGGR